MEDFAVICEQVLLTDEGGADRERSYGRFTGNFYLGDRVPFYIFAYQATVTYFLRLNRSDTIPGERE